MMGMQFPGREAELELLSCVNVWPPACFLKQRKEYCYSAVELFYVRWRPICVQFCQNASLTTFGSCLADQITIRTQRILSEFTYS